MYLGALQKRMVGAGQKGRDEQPVPEHQQRLHRQLQPAHAGKEPLPPVQDDGPHCAESGGVRAPEPQADPPLHMDAAPVRYQVQVLARGPVGEQAAQGHVFLEERPHADPQLQPGLLADVFPEVLSGKATTFTFPVLKFVICSHFHRFRRKSRDFVSSTTSD